MASADTIHTLRDRHTQVALQPGQKVEEVQFPNPLMGLLIGSGGDHIKKIQHMSDTIVTFSPEPPPAMAALGRVVTIKGSPNGIAHVKRLMSQIGQTGEVPNEITWYKISDDGSSSGKFIFHYMIPAKDVGRIIGKQGSMIEKLMAISDCHLQMSPGLEWANAAEKPLEITGDEYHKVAQARTIVADVIKRTLKPETLEGLISEQRQQTPFFNLSDGHKVMQIKVPEVKSQMVIGKNQETLKFIRNLSEVQIEMVKDGTTTQDLYRKFTMQGTQEQIDKAVSIIQHKCEDLSILPYELLVPKGVTRPKAITEDGSGDWSSWKVAEHQQSSACGGSTTEEKQEHVADLSRAPIIVETEDEDYG